MPMIDLKITPEEKKKKEKEMKAMPSGTSDDGYDYGLTIHLNEDVINKIPALKKVQGGDMIMLKAETLVKTVEVRSTDKKPGAGPKSITLQIQKMNVQPKSKDQKKDGFDDESND